MAVSIARAMLKQSSTALFVCDVQERFAKVIYEFDKIVQNATKLVNASKLLHVPMVVSEQNPKALGKTISEIDISGAKGPFAKTKFSMYIPEISKELPTLCCGKPPEAIVLIGIEAHVCIEQTAIDLRKNGYEVHAVADCISSRTQEDRLLALERLKQIGCYVTTSESVIFKLMGDSKHEQFKQIQSFVKTPTIYTGLVPLAKM